MVWIGALDSDLSGSLAFVEGKNRKPLGTSPPGPKPPIREKLINSTTEKGGRNLISPWSPQVRHWRSDISDFSSDDG